jgi:hypothetical protein
MGNLTAVQSLSPKELIELEHIENEIVGLQFDLKENKAVACRGIDRIGPLLPYAQGLFRHFP